MPDTTIDDVLGRFVYEYNERYDEWKEDDGRNSLTSMLMPVFRDTSMSILRLDALTICPPRLLGMRLDHITRALVMTAGRHVGPLKRHEIDFDPVIQTLRSLHHS